MKSLSPSRRMLRKVKSYFALLVYSKPMNKYFDLLYHSHSMDNGLQQTKYNEIVYLIIQIIIRMFLLTRTTLTTQIICFDYSRLSTNSISLSLIAIKLMYFAILSIIFLFFNGPQLLYNLMVDLEKNNEALCKNIGSTILKDALWLGNTAFNVIRYLMDPLMYSFLFIGTYKIYAILIYEHHWKVDVFLL